MKSRLQEDLIEAGKFGRDLQKRVERYEDLDAERGVNRPEGTEANMQLRHFAVKRMKDAGLTIAVDPFGNIFGRKEGLKTGAKSVMCGSHLDSVINGGQFDGALGVFSAIEAVRRMQDEGFSNDRPIEVVAFTGEEGSSFDVNLLGSSALSGQIDSAKALSTKNVKGQTLEEILLANGYKGEDKKELNDVEYFLELHIEQGPVLFSAKFPIGIVEAITGMTWLIVTIRGVSNHAGTTPMALRKDALVAAADVVGFVRDRASAMVTSRGSSTVGTVGRLNVFPNGTNIIPGKVELGIDIRDVSLKNMQDLKDDVITFLKELEPKYGIETDVEIPFMHSPVPLSEKVIKSIVLSAQKTGVEYQKMNSGAGHDAQNMASKLKTGMIFVPSVDGLSHSPMEWTHWEDVEKGAQVLTQTVKTLSKVEKT
jgi:N-carbamoyl-L-amino-acid hydrolase